MELKNRLNNSWNRMYEYARIYYEHYGNLRVPIKFKTNDGYTYDKVIELISRIEVIEE